MSTRKERDRARIRCIAAAISSLHCELARVVQDGESPEALNVYAAQNLALGSDDDGGIAGLSMDDLTDLIGSMAAMERLSRLSQAGHPVDVDVVSVMVLQGTRDDMMRRDLLLYLEGISQDRPAEDEVPPEVPPEAQA